MTIITGIITSLATILVALIAVQKDVRDILAPVLRRRRLPIVVVASSAERLDARRFVDKLRASGFRNVEFTHDAMAVLGARAVVLWKPSAAGASMAASAAERAPEAIIMVYSHDRVDGLRLSEQVLACNSQVRLLGDLAAVAGA